MDLTDILKSLGLQKITSATAPDHAQDVIERESPDVAFLDFSLGDGKSSLVIGEMLLDRGIPFAFVSGYGRMLELPPAFANVPVLDKPFGSDEVQALLEQLMPVGRPASQE